MSILCSGLGCRLAASNPCAPLATGLLKYQDEALSFLHCDLGVCCRSVLIHLLPGLALFAHRYAPVPEVVGHTWRRMFGGAGQTDLTAQTPPGFFWVFGAPLIFYLVWQLIYALIVQVSHAIAHKRSMQSFELHGM